MRRLYTIGLYLCIPFILFRLFWKSRGLPAYRQRIGERFFRNKNQISPIDIWLHAASMGEVVAATPLIDALLDKKYKILITTMTPTGSQQVIRRFGTRVAHQYVPYDLPYVFKRFFKTIQARIAIILETEIWPNMITEAKTANLILFLANARISDQAYPHYQRAAFFFKPILTQFDAILAQSPQDAERFLALGASPKNVKMVGNMKFDLQTQTIQRDIYENLRDQWGKNRPSLIAASTHHNEEEQLLIRLNKLKAAIPQLLLLIAPRHPERFKTVYELSLQHGFKTGKRSHVEALDDTFDVIVLDSMGELLGFFGVSDYAFVGGSLISLGGHNVLEPIAMHVPTFTGPYMQNSKAICDLLCAEHALYRAKDADDMVEAIINMHQKPMLRDQQIHHADQILAAHRGTVAKHLDIIESMSLM